MNKHNKIEQVPPQQKQPFLQYLATFHELTLLPVNHQHLQSGVILTELFSLIKNFKLQGICQDHPKSFSQKFSNFKILLHSIENYWNNQLGSQLQCFQIDLVEICHSGCHGQLDKFCELFVKTSAQSANKELFIQKILQTSRETQQFLRKIVEKTIQPQMKQSPRKEKEKRMIDHMMQLDHENEKLQLIISQIQDQKYDMQLKIKSQVQQLTEKTTQITRLRSCLSEEVTTPQKRRISNIPDTSERKDSQIDSLKRQIIEMNAHHEIEMQQCLSQMQKLSQKAQQFDKIKSELEFSLEIIENNRIVISQAQNLENSLSQCKAELMNKDNMIKYVQDQLQKHQGRFLEMERVEMQLRADLERRNIQLAELANKIQRNSPKKFENHHNLYLQFPDIVNTQADAYIETNRTLREQLERSRQALQSTVSQLQEAQTKIQVMSKCEMENKKLRDLLIQEKSYKGEEIDVLIHALYHLRRKVKPNMLNEQRALKMKNT